MRQANNTSTNYIAVTGTVYSARRHNPIAESHLCQAISGGLQRAAGTIEGPATTLLYFVVQFRIDVTTCTAVGSKSRLVVCPVCPIDPPPPRLLHHQSTPAEMCVQPINVGAGLFFFSELRVPCTVLACCRISSGKTPGY